VNNCVGSGNHHFFIVFLFSVTMTMILVIATISSNIRDYENLMIPLNSKFQIFPIHIYSKGLFLTAVVINLFFAGSFVLPVT
jgi:hypothetical protein